MYTFNAIIKGIPKKIGESKKWFLIDNEHGKGNFVIVTYLDDLTNEIERIINQGEKKILDLHCKISKRVNPKNDTWETIFALTKIEESNG